MLLRRVLRVELVRVDFEILRDVHAAGVARVRLHLPQVLLLDAAVLEGNEGLELRVPGVGGCACGVGRVATAVVSN